MKIKLIKNTLWLGLCALSLASCSTVQSEKNELPMIGMANPASKYCIEQGGEIRIKKAENGETGYCHLKNGQVYEEWEFFRQSQTECSAEDTKKLIGTSGLTEQQIKQKSKAAIVRSIQPGQPMTMDYRSDRITVTIEPASGKITHAVCG